jgi:hypothetical protein
MESICHATQAKSLRFFVNNILNITNIYYIIIPKSVNGSAETAAKTDGYREVTEICGTTAAPD